MIRVLSVTSEVYPLIKTGGLADVAGAMPAALSPHGFKLTTMIPGYPEVVKALDSRQVVHRYNDLLGVEARLVAGTAGGIDLLVLESPELYARGGSAYCDAKGRDWPDNWLRFGVLCKAAADVALGKVGDLHPELLHVHDWQAALAAAYLRYANGGGTIPTVVTIHNIAFPGWFPPEVFPQLDLPPEAYAVEGVEYYGGVGFLKAGLHSASAITTVSPTYAEEIRDKEFGMGLEGLIAARADRVTGIVNGIDTDVWNPATDPNLTAVYNAGTLSRRERNKRAVEKAFGLKQGDGPLFCVVSRLTAQKGMDVLAGLADALVGVGARLALLGAGDAKLEAAFIAAAKRHAGRIGVRIGYDEALAHKLQGGADAILIPSRFEPCGLTQLYGLRYGCVPVAARTGGLADTIIDANEAALAAGAATGFLFDKVDADGLAHAIARAVAVYADRAAWRSLQQQGMRADFSWHRSGKRYADLFRRLLKDSRRSVRKG